MKKTEETSKFTKIVAISLHQPIVWPGSKMATERNISNTGDKYKSAILTEAEHGVHVDFDGKRTTVPYANIANYVWG